MNKYALGIDYGTESGRVVLVNAVTGEETASHTTAYAHGVMSESLPVGNVQLAPNWALQHPADYLDVLYRSIPAVLEQANISGDQVIGIGVAFTASTILPVDAEGVPLCMKSGYEQRPHAWVKLWKHHAAHEEADEITRLAESRAPRMLARYGGSISSEWMLPKVWQLLREDPEIYEAADLFIEAGDWIVMMLTGELTRSSCAAGYKNLWSKQEGYPDRSFLEALDPGLAALMETKLRGEVIPVGSRAGRLDAAMAGRLGLPVSTAVAASTIDAHASMIGTGVIEPGSMVIVAGTSSCHMLIDEKLHEVEGICGVVEDGIVPDYFAYEAGQPAVGDMLAWFVNQSVPEPVHRMAQEEGLSVHGWLEREAAAYKPGQSGLLALDWWNGNRSVLGNSKLSGAVIGLNLLTKPEEIYRALLEASAFGTRRIIEAFQASGVAVDRVYVSGGLPHRNALMMQIYADVLGVNIMVASSKQASGLGAALYALVAAGSADGGFDCLQDAAAELVALPVKIYEPDEERNRLYLELYAEYAKLHDYFGQGGNSVMEKLEQYK